MDISSTGTKNRIFMTSMRLFASNGVENVSIRTIADSVGIKAASIYNHYSSKEQILDACYNFYVENRHITRLTKEQYEPILKNGSKKEIFDVLSYSFPNDIIEPMIMSLVIIFARIYSDSKAKEVYADDVNCSIEYLKEFFATGIELGRFGEFNIDAVSLIILSSRLFLAQSVTIYPTAKDEWHVSQGDMFDELVRLIPFKY